MALLDDVKLALRITHTKLDSDITDTISAAEAELKRAGVDADIAEAAEAYPLVKRAIKTYCMMVYSIDQTQSEGYQKSFEIQLDNLRKSAEYNGGDLDAE